MKHTCILRWQGWWWKIAPFAVRPISLRCHMNGKWYNLRWTASLEHAKIFGLTALKHLNKKSCTASTWKAILSPIFPRKGKIWLQRILINLFRAIYVEGKVRLESSGNYVIWIELRSSLSYHRTIEFGSMEQWRWHDGAMTMTRWYDSTMATVRWHDDADAKEQWQWSDALSRHRYRTIVIASLHHCAIYRHFALFLKKWR